MIIEKYIVTNSNKGKRVVESRTTHNIINYIENTVDMKYKGGSNQISHMQVTTFNQISGQDVLRINGNWYNVITYKRGMSNVYLYYLEETTEPISE